MADVCKESCGGVGDERCAAALRPAALRLSRGLGLRGRKLAAVRGDLQPHKVGEQHEELVKQLGGADEIKGVPHALDRMLVRRT